MNSGEDLVSLMVSGSLRLVIETLLMSSVVSVISVKASVIALDDGVVRVGREFVSSAFDFLLMFLRDFFFPDLFPLILSAGPVESEVEACKYSE